MTNDNQTFEQEFAKLREQYPNSPEELLRTLAELTAYPLEEF